MSNLRKCNLCDCSHDITSGGKISKVFADGWFDYYMGLAHMTETSEVLVYNGYSWIKPEEAGMPEGFTAFEANKPTELKEGDWEWFPAYHGCSGFFFEVKESKTVGAGAIYAQRIE
jgi:hypothetical protein